jgi:Carboxypeptidase regulatory-like domain
MRHIALLLVAAGLAVAPAAGATSHPGIRGQVRLSHGCPGPAREGDMRRCDFPGAHVLVRVYAAKQVVASARTNADGRFTFALAPGSYSVAAVVKNALHTRPVTVRVRTDHWTSITLRYLVAPLME